MARGDEDFTEFVQASSPGLLRAAYLLTGDRHVAEDAAQTALVRTYAAWSRVRRDDAFAYARRVLVNHVTDRWRRRLREYATGALPDQPARTDVAEEVATRQYLIGALASLTARERAVVVMRYFFDLPEATVAGELQITVGTVKSTSARALAKLRISPDRISPDPGRTRCRRPLGPSPSRPPRWTGRDRSRCLPPGAQGARPARGAGDGPGCLGGQRAGHPRDHGQGAVAAPPQAAGGRIRRPGRRRRGGHRHQPPQRPRPSVPGPGPAPGRLAGIIGARGQSRDGRVQAACP